MSSIICSNSQHRLLQKLRAQAEEEPILAMLPWLNPRLQVNLMDIIVQTFSEQIPKEFLEEGGTVTLADVVTFLLKTIGPKDKETLNLLVRTAWFSSVQKPAADGGHSVGKKILSHLSHAFAPAAVKPPQCVYGCSMTL